LILEYRKNLTKTLICIYQVDSCRSRYIEKGTNLRQSEVSRLTEELSTREWIEKRHVKKKGGKGRPYYNISKRSIELSKILKTIEQEKLQEIEDSELLPPKS